MWFSPERELVSQTITATQNVVNGSVHLMLYKGNVVVVGRSSPCGLYDQTLSSVCALWLPFYPLDGCGGWIPSGRQRWFHQNPRHSSQSQPSTSAADEIKFTQTQLENNQLKFIELPEATEWTHNATKNNIWSRCWVPHIATQTVNTHLTPIAVEPQWKSWLSEEKYQPSRSYLMTREACSQCLMIFLDN